MAKIDAFFKLMNDQGASDLHLVSGQPPALRLRGDVERIKYKVLEDDDQHEHDVENAHRRHDPTGHFCDPLESTEYDDEDQGRHHGWLTPKLD